MNWKDLTSYQKIYSVELTPNTTIEQIDSIINHLQSPWKESKCKFSWYITDRFLLKIHAQKVSSKS